MEREERGEEEEEEGEADPLTRVKKVLKSPP